MLNTLKKIVDQDINSGSWERMPLIKKAVQTTPKTFKTTEMPAGFFDIPFDKYLKMDGISCSQLKYILECPKKFNYFVREEHREDSADLRWGRALHALLLEPAIFEDLYYIIPKIRRVGKAWEEKQEEAKGREILWVEEMEELQHMVKSVNENTDASRFLENSRNEISMQWTTRIGETNVQSRGRVDAVKIHNDKIALIDIKTTKDASKRAFQGQIFNYNYHMQAAYYMDGYYKLTNIMPELFVFITIEKMAPYICELYYIQDPAIISDGRGLYLKAIKKVLECNEQNNWKGGYEDSPEITFPTWYNPIGA